MASVGHIAVGLAAARTLDRGHTPRWPSVVAWCTLSLLPDVDVIGFALGVEYADAWGHRGATHSVAMAAALGLAIGLCARWFGRPAMRTALFASLILISHPLLDTMTDGGLGCALWWPLDLSRYFAPWRPIPVAPIGLHLATAEGARVVLTELILFAPLFLVAVRYARLSARPLYVALFLTAWALSAWLIVSSSRARESLVGFVLREDTAYTGGFSEDAFRAVEHDDSVAEVRRLLGAPMKEVWIYGGNPASGPALETSAQSMRGRCATLHFHAGRVAATFDTEACTQRGIRTGMSLADVEQRLGVPPERDWQYTWSAGGGHHRMRIVAFTGDRVSMIMRRWN
jgi:inner membrane protein